MSDTPLTAPIAPSDRLSRRQKPWLLIGGCLAVTTVLWVAGRVSIGFGGSLWPWLAPSQVVMLWSFTCAALAIVVVSRAQALEPLIGGLDNGVRLHRRLGLAAFLLMGLHVVLLCLHAVQLGQSAAVMLVPFWPGARTVDIAVFYLLAGLGVLAYAKRMRHELWLNLHRVIGVLFLLGTAHASIEDGTIRFFEPLRTWIVILLLSGTVAWTYRVLLFRSFGPRFLYTVQRVVQRGPRVVDLELRPRDRRMMYQPGTFAFLRTPSLTDHSAELHPFSISGSPVKRDLRFSISQVGDFTRAVSDLSPGDEVEVFGSFGGFTQSHFAPYRRMVWIGAGIGITPFLGMLEFEKSNDDFRRIWFYYITRTPEDAVYDSEIRDRFLEADSYIDYNQWTTTDRGRLTAAQIMEEVELGDFAVMLCGSSPFVEDMVKQFLALGVPAERIIYEHLQFR
ncbi:ferredoxin reductase family protein [Pseudooceanicola algae]|uniref:Flavohemoprotein n=1 Tax=Pseudooceanicola algae TaxID=1537215 RepID=A0A418SJB2_9RHOB|nr:ferredoxin reductase family protein [Pseudooceanicola algae]QPM91833.1 Flavohemoprotein [Pseudooceanicola algae]